jgi:hypothetical protein
MKISICVAVAIIIDIPDDDLPIRAPVKDPLDNFTARLRREATFGRDIAKPRPTSADTKGWAMGVYRRFVAQS